MLERDEGIWLGQTFLGSTLCRFLPDCWIFEIFCECNLEITTLDSESDPIVVRG